MAKTTMQLEQITCPTCVKKIEGALAKIKGVESSSVSFNTSKVRAEYDEAKVKAEDIKGTIEKLGFEVLSVD